jgi:hypothetical protein
MFKRKKKKTGVQTPEFRQSTPPPPPTSGSNAVKPNPNYVPPASVKKTGYKHIDSEKLKAPTPVTMFEDHCKPKQIRAFSIGTEERLDVFLSAFNDAMKIENADIYWSEKDGVIAVCTTREWVDYMTGKSNIIPNAKENNKCKD